MSTRNGLKNLRFKRCSKADWKKTPSYTCYYGKMRIGEMYFWEGDDHSVFAFDTLAYDWNDRSYFTIDQVRMLQDIMPEIAKKMREFEEEVINEKD